MEFGLSRGEMLDLLAKVMLVPDEGRTAFLGRFQHLQRLALVDGINPGRGKAAQYRAEQVIVIAIAMQFLQLGLSPERTVRMMHRQYRDVDQSRRGLSITATRLGSAGPSSSVAKRMPRRGMWARHGR